ncbi:MAG: GspH/FimT family pseudopilin [Candidatus Binatia bacterium]
MRRKTTATRGFTLLHVLVAIAILSTLAAIAVPNWGTLLPGYRLNSAARQVATELQSARNRAMAEYRRFKVVFDTATTFTVQREQTPGLEDYAVSSGPKSLPSGITAAFTGTPVFQPRGDASQAVTITLTNSKGDTRQAVVSLTGRVDIQ